MDWEPGDNLADVVAAAHQELNDVALRPDRLFELTLDAETALDDLYEDCLENSDEAALVKTFLRETTRRWRSAEMRRTTEESLAAHQPADTAADTADVVYAIRRFGWFHDVRCFVEAHRIDHHEERSPVTVVALRSPRWAWRALEQTLEGVGLSSPEQLGAPLPCPSPDTLEIALALWEPTDPHSPYRTLKSALGAGDKV